MKKGLIAGTIALLATLVGVATAPPADALSCSWPTEAGEWENISPGNPEIARLKLILPGDFCVWPWQLKEPIGGPGWYLEASGACALFFECSWGRTRAVHLDERRSGYVDSIYGRVWISPIFAAFDQGKSQKYLYVHTALDEPELLEVRVYTDYADGGPSDTVRQFRFRRVGKGLGRPGRPGTLLLR